MNDLPLLQQFDQVELLTTKGVTYMSDRPGNAPSPHGIWNVVGIIEGEALLAKESALIRIPINDIKKVATYNPAVVMDMLKGVTGRGQEKEKRIRRSD